MNKEKNSPHLLAHQPGGAVVPKFSKARSIAARYGLCSRTIFRLADRNLIHRFKLNPRVVVFDENEVAALFESARVTTRGPAAQVQGAARARAQDGRKGGEGI